jgi:hypothetical protein
MDQVLCIDLSVEPARAVLTAVENTKLSVIDSREFSLNGVLDFDQLLRVELIQNQNKGNNKGPEQNNDTADNADDNLENTSELQAQPIEPLVKAISELPKTWTNSILIIPMHEYLSLNLTLPFADQKNILKIIDFEVQDLVPFEVDEFAIEGHALSSSGPNQHDVHVSLVPRIFIANMLSLCRASGLEPSIITTPCSGLANLPLLAPDYFKDTYALISVTAEGVYICASVDGKVRFDKSIIVKGPEQQSSSNFLGELKLALMSFEKKYSKTFSNVYVEGSQKLVAELQQKLGRPIESIEMSDFVTTNNKKNARTALVALFASETRIATPLTNFRVREFAFKPNWRALLQTLYGLRKYFIAACLLLVFSVFASYQLRKLQISRLESAVREKIRATVPNLKGKAGDEIPAFKGELLTLTKELESLGSSNEISPMNILVELTKDLSTINDTTINEIDIRPDRVLLDISVPDYAAADRIERVLKRKKDIFRRIRKDAASYSSASGGRNFNFELKLYD